MRRFCSSSSQPRFVFLTKRTALSHLACNTRESGHSRFARSLSGSGVVELTRRTGERTTCLMAASVSCMSALPNDDVARLDAAHAIWRLSLAQKRSQCLANFPATLFVGEALDDHQRSIAAVQDYEKPKRCRHHSHPSATAMT
jgi:hypothetical protein